MNSQAEIVPETPSLPAYTPLDRPQNRRRSRRPAVKASRRRDRTVKRAMARALTPRATRKAAQAAQARERQRGWEQHFKAGGSVGRHGQAVPADQAHVATWDPYYVDPAQIERYYSADPHSLGASKVSLYPPRCTDDELHTWRARAAEAGLLTREQLDDVHAALRLLGNAVTTDRLAQLAEASRQDQDLGDIVEGWLGQPDGEGN